MTVEKNEVSKPRFEDPQHDGFHGFDQLETEVRGDAYFYGKASDFVAAKADLTHERPRNCMSTPITGCFIGGPVRAMVTFEGAVAIFHGPAGCANYELIECGVVKPYTNILSTQMDEQDALLGGGEKLEAAIREVIDRDKPSMIGVIGTCTSAINGDDFEGICEALEEETGIPIMAFPAAGFRSRTWNLGSEEAMNRIIDRMQKPEPEEVNRGSVNFLNFPVFPRHWVEILDLLPYFARLGIKLNTHAPAASTFAEFVEDFPKAELNITRCTGVGLVCAEYAKKELGIPYLRLPKPVSLTYTERFLRELAEFFGSGEEVEELIREERIRIAPRLDRAKAKLKGKRIAIACGSGKNIAMAQMAHEFGMEVVYLGPWKVDSYYQELLGQWIKESGQDPEFMSEAAVYELEAILGRLRPDLYIGIADEIPAVSRLGIPALEFMYLPTRVVGFEGVAATGEFLAKNLEHGLMSRYGAEMWQELDPYSGDDYIENSELAQTSPQDKGEVIKEGVSA